MSSDIAMAVLRQEEKVLLQSLGKIDELLDSKSEEHSVKEEHLQLQVCTTFEQIFGQEFRKKAKRYK